jgi:hypothetical protein
LAGAVYGLGRDAWQAASPLGLQDVLPLQHVLQLAVQTRTGATSGVFGLLTFGILSCLAVLSAGPRSTAFRSFIQSGLAWGAGVGFAAVVRGLELGHVPGGRHMLLPSVGCAAGVWFGAKLLRGPATAVRAALRLAACLLLAAGVGVVLDYFALDTTAIPFEPPAVTSAEKRRLVQLVQSGRSGCRDGIKTRELRLTDADANLLFAWGLSLGPPGRKCQVGFGENTFEIRASVETSIPGLGPRYLNARAAGQLAAAGENRRFQLDSIQLGRITAPQWLVKSSRPLVKSVVADKQSIGDALASVQMVQLKSGTMEVVCEQDSFRNRLLPSLLEKLGAKPDVGPQTAKYLEHLTNAADKFPKDAEKRFASYLRAAFAMAESRSQSHDPALENRAAIFALAILLGHRHVDRFVGTGMSVELQQKARQQLGRVAIRGRRDWPRHFFVSAAASLLSVEAVSNSAGLLKEELDAAQGGSGFSFADLLADRAGTRFATAATRDEESARAMQKRLSRRFAIDDLVPPAADLPEGVSDAELQSKYGGVGGEGYQKVIQEIERRLARCPLLK